MGEAVWYYEYTVKILSEGTTEFRSGVVPETSFSEVAQDLDDYYGEGLVEILKIKPITDSVILDFKDALDYNDFDFTVTPKDTQRR